MLTRTGTTEDGKPVISGAFTMTATHGLPLEMILEHFREKGWVVDWLDYAISAARDGHKPSTITGRVHEAVADVYGPEYAEKHRQSMQSMLENIGYGC